MEDYQVVALIAAILFMRNGVAVNEQRITRAVTDACIILDEAAGRVVPKEKDNELRTVSGKSGSREIRPGCENW